jgi:hypothetical protein
MHELVAMLCGGRTFFPIGPSAPNVPLELENADNFEGRHFIQVQ